MASEKKLADEFAPVAKEYAKFRPHYPPELVTDLLAYFDANCKVPRAEAIALDVGTGSGQIAQPLAVAGFKEVHGIDKSAPQMKEAKQHPALIYRVGTDQQTGAADKSVALVTVAQAAHWFDLPKFYQEVRRISVPTATLSIIGYAICSVAEPAEVQPIFAAYYKSLDDYWPKECDRDLLDSGFASAAFPFQNESRKWYHQRTTMTLGTFLGYVRTWSALTMFKQKNPQTEEPSIALEKKLLTIPGLSNLDSPITISYPFFMINTTVQE